MALNSSSTKTDALAQYNDNLSWEGNPTKAALALEAVRWLLINRPQSISKGDRSLNYAEMSAEKNRLETYITSRGNAVNRTSFTRGRMLL